MIRTKVNNKHLEGKARRINHRISCLKGPNQLVLTKEPRERKKKKKKTKQNQMEKTFFDEKQSHELYHSNDPPRNELETLPNKEFYNFFN